MSDKNLRIAIMWTELSGYLNACLKAITSRYDVELDVTRIVTKTPSRHPYDDTTFDWLPRLRTLSDARSKNADKLLTEIMTFKPHVVIIAGWDMPVYRKIARNLRQQGVYVIGTADNPWLGSIKQHLGALISPLYVQPMFDVLWVPGECGVSFARHLGFSGKHLMQGLYSADRARFSSIGEWRNKLDKAKWPQRFFFAGRLSREKGIEDLVSAYRRYLDVTNNPWELLVAGSGPLEDTFLNVDGVRMLGFVQPEQYDQILRKISVFVLPSHYDPWPLVIHEMTLAGLPIVCSQQCGSAVELVQDGYNGFLFEAGDVDALVSLLQLMSGANIDLPEMGRRSSVLSNRYSPEQWADYLVGHITRYVQTN